MLAAVTNTCSDTECVVTWLSITRQHVSKNGTCRERSGQKSRAVWRFLEQAHAQELQHPNHALEHKQAWRTATRMITIWSQLEPEVEAHELHAFLRNTMEPRLQLSSCPSGKSPMMTTEGPAERECICYIASTCGIGRGICLCVDDLSTTYVDLQVCHQRMCAKEASCLRVITGCKPMAVCDGPFRSSYTKSCCLNC